MCVNILLLIWFCSGNCGITVYGMEGGQKLIKHQYIRKLLSVNVGVKCLKKDMHHLMI